GGLGSRGGVYRSAPGVGRSTVADDDVVQISNMQRQILQTTATVDVPKAQSGVQMLQRLNRDITLVPLVRRLTGEDLYHQVLNADVVLDCCDNFDTRHAVNRACVRAKKPLVSGAAIRFSGQLSVYDLRQSDSPCYHCLFPEGGEVQELRDRKRTRLNCSH